ncbi:MAG: hypothetical protein HQM16_18610 [Deltaproteobacteria bacterium]|nr:hypothetical protein [Deltaproteobacteria bacterium]
MSDMILGTTSKGVVRLEDNDGNGTVDQGENVYLEIQSTNPADTTPVKIEAQEYVEPELAELGIKMQKDAATGEKRAFLVGTKRWNLQSIIAKWSGAAASAKAGRCEDVDRNILELARLAKENKVAFDNGKLDALQKGAYRNAGETILKEAHGLVAVTGDLDKAIKSLATAKELLSKSDRPLKSSEEKSFLKTVYTHAYKYTEGEVVYYLSTGRPPADTAKQIERLCEYGNKAGIDLAGISAKITELYQCGVRIVMEQAKEYAPRGEVDLVYRMADLAVVYASAADGVVIDHAAIEKLVRDAIDNAHAEALMNAEDRAADGDVPAMFDYIEEAAKMLDKAKSVKDGGDIILLMTARAEKRIPAMISTGYKNGVAAVQSDAESLSFSGRLYETRTLVRLAREYASKGAVAITPKMEKAFMILTQRALERAYDEGLSNAENAWGNKYSYSRNAWIHGPQYADAKESPVAMAGRHIQDYLESARLSDKPIDQARIDKIFKDNILETLREAKRSHETKDLGHAKYLTGSIHKWIKDTGVSLDETVNHELAALDKQLEA